MATARGSRSRGPLIVFKEFGNKEKPVETGTELSAGREWQMKFHVIDPFPSIGCDIFAFGDDRPAFCFRQSEKKLLLRLTKGAADNS